MKLTAIDKAFGVAESTGQGKSKAIRTMLKIRQFDPEWTLPGRMDDNPLIWMLEVNGLITDIRSVPEGGPGGRLREGPDPLHPRRPGGRALPRSEPWPTRRRDRSPHASSRGSRSGSSRAWRDPDFPDIPLGGWAGTIEDESSRSEGQITYVIEWDRRTLGGMHPVYKKRCERDGLDPETMWLGRGGPRSRRRHAGPHRAAHGDQARRRCRRRTRTIGSARPSG